LKFKKRKRKFDFILTLPSFSLYQNRNCAKIPAPVEGRKGGILTL